MVVTVDNLTNTQVLRLKGRIFTVTVVQLLQDDLLGFEQNIQGIIQKAPKLLNKIPVVLDCTLLDTALESLRPYFEVIKKYHLYPIGVQGQMKWLSQLAAKESFPLFQASSAQDKNLESKEKPKPASDPVAVPTKVITLPVRSGQQIVGKGGDLVVIASVGHGAELLADGNIHVYGPLRGRALAGIKGDKSARIFCTQLDAELVSIAGFYRLRESIPQINGPCQIFIQDERLQIIPL
jgi:septum site-determining protein MinC